MNKMREYERGREDGLLLALKITEQDGIDGLRKEVKFRGATGIHTSLACKDLDKASQQIKDITRDCFIILSVAALHDAFGFGETRVQRFINKFNEGADYLDQGLATWQDYIDGIKEQLNLTLDIRDGSRPLENKEVKQA